MMAQVQKVALSAVASSNQTAISSHISFRPTSCPLLPLSFLPSPAPKFHPGHPPALAAIRYEYCASHKFRHIAPHLSLCRTLHVSASRNSPFHKRRSEFFVAIQRWFRASADSGSETDKTSPRTSRPKAQKPDRQKDDPGECKYSPEWFGTQGGGWGRNPGATVFAESSAFGNGVVSVTAHESSRQPADSPPFMPPGISSSLLGHEWCALRFNSVTRQSVARVAALRVEGRGGEAVIVKRQQPECLAFEYLKTMTSAGLTAASLAGLQLSAPSADVSIPKPRILCIGLGGGSLPLFLAHHVPDSSVDVVEIDPTVIAAATEGMGFPKCSLAPPPQKQTSAPAPEEAVWAGEGGILGRLKLFCDDGASFVRKKLLQIHKAKVSPITQNLPPRGGIATSAAPAWTPVHSASATSLSPPPFSTSAHQTPVTPTDPGQSARSPPGSPDLYDLVFIDAYDGNDEVPTELWEEGGPFLRHLADVLNPIHGTVLVNLHGNCPAPSLLQRVTGRYGPGYHLDNSQGKIVHRTCTAYRNALVSPPPLALPTRNRNIKPQGLRPNGIAFTVATQRQGNVILVVTRGLHPSTTATWQSPGGQHGRNESKCGTVDEIFGSLVPSRGSEEVGMGIEELTKTLATAMLEAGQRLGKSLKFPFVVGQRVNWRLHLVVGEETKS